MLVRAVAAALAVWCVSGAALAAGYAEVWNPPEASGQVASGHIAQAERKRPDAVKVSAGAGANGGSKAGSGAHVKRVASVRYEASHGGKLAAHRGGAKKIAANAGVKHGTKSGMRIAATGTTHAHGNASARAAKPHTGAHTQLARAKPAQGKVMRANFAPGRTARPQAIKTTARPAVARAAVSRTPVAPLAPAAPAASASPAESVNLGNVVPMGASAQPVNPATARSGSLPPIIH